MQDTQTATITPYQVEEDIHYYIRDKFQHDPAGYYVRGMVEEIFKVYGAVDVFNLGDETMENLLAKYDMSDSLANQVTLAVIKRLGGWARKHDCRGIAYTILQKYESRIRPQENFVHDLDEYEFESIKNYYYYGK